MPVGLGGKSIRRQTGTRIDLAKIDRTVFQQGFSMTTRGMPFFIAAAEPAGRDRINKAPGRTNTSLKMAAETQK